MKRCPLSIPPASLQTGSRGQSDTDEVPGAPEEAVLLAASGERPRGRKGRRAGPPERGGPANSSGSDHRPPDCGGAA